SVLLTGILTTATSWAQLQDGNLVGSVFDSSGAPIPGAKVEVENTATGITVTTVADPTGFYRFNNLLVGAYRVTAGAAGMAPSSPPIEIELSKTATANLTLSVSGVAQEITVADTPALIDTTTAQLANTYSEQPILNLALSANPVAGGVYNLSLANAGVTSAG